MSANATSSASVPVTFNQSPYPWPDEILTTASVVAQCVVAGTSGSVQPSWPAASVLTQDPNSAGGYLFNTVTDGQVQWQQVGYYPQYFSLSSTSSTSASVSTGSKTFTTQSGLGYTATSQVSIVDSTGYGYLYGTVTSYSGTSLVVNITFAYGTGSFTSWRITQLPNSSWPGGQGVWIAQVPVSDGDLIIANAYLWKCTHVTGASSGATQPPWTSLVDGNVVWQIVGVN
jgi:hypothetical protein